MIRRATYWLCVVLVGVEVFYGLYWAFIDIAIRADLWPMHLHLSFRQLIPSLTWWQEALFFLDVTLKTLALIALLWRWWACVPLFITAFILDRIDWILLGLNPVAGGGTGSWGDWTDIVSNFGGIGLMAYLQIFAIGLLLAMLQTDQLSRRLPKPLARLLNRRV